VSVTVLLQFRPHLRLPHSDAGSRTSKIILTIRDSHKYLGFLVIPRTVTLVFQASILANEEATTL
jgi:hypothetical protein